jgi:hypothetical protein
VSAMPPGQGVADRSPAWNLRSSSGAGATSEGRCCRGRVAGICRRTGGHGDPGFRRLDARCRRFRPRGLGCGHGPRRRSDIGTVESDNGQSTLPGVHSGSNSAWQRRVRGVLSRVLLRARPANQSRLHSRKRHVPRILAGRSAAHRRAERFCAVDNWSLRARESVAHAFTRRYGPAQSLVNVRSRPAPP